MYMYGGQVWPVLTSHKGNRFFPALFQVNMEDKFGQVMMDNLRARDCLLHTEYCSSLQSQIERYNLLKLHHRSC